MVQGTVRGTRDTATVASSRSQMPDGMQSGICPFRLA